ncbi:hypothetical protein FQA39_LY02931 [Lamprigera yunnana]|nr:hypothetical protein FQA39_LY02931 [Lamprigera yunnana]
MRASWLMNINKMKVIQLINYCMIATCFAGLCLSMYAYHVERAIEEDDNYVASCDFSEHMSCTKAFKSKYGKGFGIISSLLGEDSFLNKPNSLFGVIYYSFLATLVFSDAKNVTRVALFASIASNLASLYFAFILFFILYDVCIVCLGIYVVNCINLILITMKMSIINEMEIMKLKQN